ncbi:hypothetical protein [Methanohalobium sp.]|uniref:hypothetical protein n=1 Tax=Methanohalobium sp. TaxID=2837493 RepID=UPI0025E562BC|nr:hypothetical protein [Methanohalobium sp.]
MTNFFKTISKGIDNEYMSVASEGIDTGDVTGYIDTGSYVFNGMLSGSIYNGMPDNKIMAIAGEEATGKTYFALSQVKHFLDQNPDGLAVYFESEGAISKMMLEERNIDTSRVLIVPVMTVEEFRHQATKISKNYEAIPKDERKKMFFLLDSFGMLSTSKEVSDVEEGNDTRDMTRAQLARGTFRVLSLRLAKLGIPLVVTNHTYEGMSAYSPKVMGGGKGLYFACSNIVFLSKRKEKDGQSGPTIGNVITCTLRKGRLTRENSTCEVLLTYDKGLHPYHGLVDLACEAGVFKKVSTKIELPDGSSHFKKHIDKNPERFFTDDVMRQLDEYAAKKYLYGSTYEEQGEMQEKQKEEFGDNENV